MDGEGRAMHGAIAESNAGAVAEEQKLCLPFLVLTKDAKPL
jgi:hypothetical protein